LKDKVMRTFYILALSAPIALLCTPAMADPPDLTDTVAQAMQQATAITEETRADAAKTGDRLSQASTQALYARYRAATTASGASASKPCDHPPALEAGGLCIPVPAGK
jgi:hypothetical protein